MSRMIMIKKIKNNENNSALLKAWLFNIVSYSFNNRLIIEILKYFCELASYFGDKPNFICDDRSTFALSGTRSSEFFGICERL